MEFAPSWGMTRTSIVVLLLTLGALATSEAQIIRQHLNAVEHTMMVTSSVLIVADWAQTTDFRARGNREGNPILGSYPSQGRVNTLIGLGLATNLLVSRIPWRMPRMVIWSMVLVGETYAVTHNAGMPQSGMSFKF
jgi:hypothetical protein